MLSFITFVGLPVQEEVYLQRVGELDQITNFRDEQRKLHDNLRKQRLDEFMTGFQVVFDLFNFSQSFCSQAFLWLDFCIKFLFAANREFALIWGELFSQTDEFEKLNLARQVILDPLNLISKRSLLNSC